jgi:hypothetical protein
MSRTLCRATLLHLAQILLLDLTRKYLRTRLTRPLQSPVPKNLEGDIPTQLSLGFRLL